MFDSYDGYTGDSLDAGQLKKDTVNHKLTSLGNLHVFTKTMASTPVDRKERRRQMRDPNRPARAMSWNCPSTTGQEALQDSIDWLNANRHELPPELESEQGERGSTSKLELPSYDLVMVEESVNQAIADASREDASVGLYYVGGHTAHNTRADLYAELTRESSDDQELRTRLLSLGFPTQEVQLLLAKRKAGTFATYWDKRGTMLRWRGMQEYRAVAVADAHLAKGKTLKLAKSGAKECPSQERLSELLSYDKETGVFTRVKSAGRSKAGTEATVNAEGRLRVDGQLYYASRLAYVAMTGSDPMDATIDFNDGDPTNLAWDNLSLQVTANSLVGGADKEERSVFKDKYMARLNDRVKIGAFDTEEEAVKAREVYIKAMLRG